MKIYVLALSVSFLVLLLAAFAFKKGSKSQKKETTVVESSENLNNVLGVAEKKELHQADILAIEANFLQDAQAYNRALAKYQKALAIRQKILKTADEDDAYILYNMGIVLAKIGNKEEAFHAFSQSLKIFKSLPMPSTKMLFFIYKDGFAALALAQNKLDEAIDYWQQAIALKGVLEALPLEMIGSVYAQMGKTYYKKKEYDLALESAFHALGHYKSMDNINYKAIYKIYKQVGRTYQKQGNFPEAIQYLKKAIVLLEYGNFKASNDHRDYYIYLLVAKLYKKLKDYAPAVSYTEKAFNKMKEYKADIDPELLPLYKELGVLHHLVKNYTLSAFYLEKYIGLSRFKSSDQETMDNLILLGDSYMELDKYWDAISSFADAYTIASSISPQDTEYMTIIKERIRVAKIYERESSIPQEFGRDKQQDLLSMPYARDNLFVILSSIAFFAYAIFSVVFYALRQNQVSFTLLGIGAWYLLGFIILSSKRVAGNIKATTTYINFPSTMITDRSSISKYITSLLFMIIAPFLSPFLGSPTYVPIEYPSIKKVYLQKKYIQDSSNQVIPIFMVHLAVLHEQKIKSISFSTLNVSYSKLASFINLLDLIGIEYHFRQEAYDLDFL